MFRQLFANMGPVVKNFLIINAIMLGITYVAGLRGLDLVSLLGMHSFKSPSFYPFQIVTHMFMHGDLMHLIGNMFGLVFFGSQLERVWGSKRFLIFYFITGFGALALYMGVNYFHFMQLTSGLSPEEINYVITSGHEAFLQNKNFIDPTYAEINSIVNTPMVGASGAIFGIITAFAMLFPNTTIQLLIPPIPLKAKWFAIIYIGIELYLGFANNPGDHIAHFAHLGGALIAFIIVKIWNKNRNNFY